MNLVSLPLANLTLWVTPLWIVSLGVTAALVLLAALLGILWLVRRPAAESAITLVQEGVLAPISYVLLTFVAIFFLAWPIVPAERIFESVRRLGDISDTRVNVTVPPRTEDLKQAVSLRTEELVGYRFESDRDVRIAARAEEAYSRPAAVVQGGEPYVWDRLAKRSRGFEGQDEVTEIYLTNEGDAPATVDLLFESEVRIPEVHNVPIIVAAVVGLFLIFALIHLLLPGISNIAVATAKEAIGQPLFLLFLLGGAAALVIYIVLPYNTFGEDVKMLKDSGLNTIMVLSIIFALWTASVSVAEEIEGKTALTLLSKPISRRQFVLGKFFGIVSAVLVIFVVLGALLMATISYKVVYDARETSNPTPEWQECHETMIGVVPGLVLAFLETTALAAVSVAISTRLPMLPNLLICGAVYVLGHLTPLIAQSTVGELEFVQFFAKLFAVILPELDHFNIQAAVAAGKPVPAVYLAWTSLYCLAYCTFAMLLALILFEDRDLA